MNRKRILGIILAASLFFSQSNGLMAFRAQAAGNKVYEVKNEADFLAMAGFCRDASWSMGRVVEIKADITLSGPYNCIPYFDGEIDGGGHTIADLTIERDASKSALIAETGPDAFIHDLNVTGNITPEGSQGQVAGLVGENSGRIASCSFDGSVLAGINVGGIAGVNSKKGRISLCSVSGTIEGTTRVGGIAGENQGIITGCKNTARVNTAEQDDTMSGDNLEAILEHIVSRGNEGVALSDSGYTISDVGGVAGYSTGRIIGCENEGPVGYSYVGYNIGGITGRTSGYVADSKNSGEVLGRKDVGGIAGQLVPYMKLDISKDDAKLLQDELNRLNDMVSDATYDMEGYATGSTDIINELSTELRSAEGYIKDISDGVSDYAGDAADQWNINADVAGSAAGDLSGILMELQSGVDNLEEATDVLLSETDAFIQKNKISDEDKEKLNKASDKLEKGVSRIDESYDSLTDSIESLKSHLNTLNEDYKNSEAQKVAKSAVAVLNDLADISEHYSKLMEVLTVDVVPAIGTMTDIIAKLASGGAALPQGITEEDQKKLEEAQKTITAAVETVKTSAVSLDSAIASLRTHINELNTGLNNIEKERERFYKDMTAVSEDVTEILSLMSSILSDINGKVIPAISTVTSIYSKTLKNVDAGNLRDAVMDEQAAIDDLPGSLSALGEVLGNVADSMDMEIPDMDEKVSDSGDRLYESMLRADDKIRSLSDLFGDGASALSGDVRAISDQMNHCINIFMDAIQEVGTVDLDLKDRVHDTSAKTLSDKQIKGLRHGHVTGCENSGIITAAMNTGGIAGNVGVESELDPEEDLGGKVDFNDDSALLSKCVIDGCKDAGEISTRRNNAGGIAGVMDFGLIYKCESYGTIGSENGSYVGGISGYSGAAIRKSFAKCFLSGSGNVGGIAGYGTILSDNTAMVRITGADQEYGAIAGSVEDRSDANISGNRFVAEDESTVDEKLRPDVIAGATSGIGGISFPGMAEEISYKKLLKRRDLPSEFKVITLTFEADDKIIAKREVNYGAGLAASDIPEIPAREDCSAKWDRADFSDIRGDDNIKAIYSVSITSIAGTLLRHDRQAALLAVGDLDSSGELIVSEDTPSGDELERLHVSIDVDGVSEYRYRPPVDDGVELYIEKAGKSEKLTTETFGKYLVFKTDEKEFELIARSGCFGSFGKWAYIAMAAVLAAGVVLILLYRKKKGRGSEKKEEKEK